MAHSKFYDLFTEEVSKSGYRELFESHEFTMLVKKTVITRRSRENDSLYTYLDDRGNILFECMEKTVRKENRDTPLPRLGTVEEIDRRAEYVKNYQQKKVRQFHIALTAHDSDIIEYLDQLDNKQFYIKELIRADMKKKKARQGK